MNVDTGTHIGISHKVESLGPWGHGHRLIKIKCNMQLGHVRNLFNNLSQHSYSLSHEHRAK